MPDTGRIDVEALPSPPHLSGWVIVYPLGSRGPSDTPTWHGVG
jgi:hypothetical protein